MRKIEQVKKRDGRIVPYDETKIADAIFKAAQAVGGEDRYLATELARVVTMFLERYYQKEVPEIEDIHDMVEKVLIETGHARTAKAYILYRVNKAKQRKAGPEAPEPPRLLVLDPANREAIQPWDRERLRLSMERDGACPAQLSGDVARQVEERLVATGLHRITPGLVREVTSTLLFDRGLLSSPHQPRAEPVDGIGDVIFRSTTMGRTPATVARELGERWLARVAAERLLLPDVVAAHNDGRIRLWPFEDVLRVDTLPLPLGVEGLALVPWLREHVAGGFIVTPPPTPEAAERVKEALAAAPADRHVVRLAAGTPLPAVKAYAQALLPDRVASVELTLTPADLADDSHIEALSGLSGIRLLFERALPEPPLAQGVNIRLAGLGTMGGFEGTDKFFLMLEPLVTLAVAAHLDRHRFLRRLSSGPGLPLSGLCVPGRTGLADPFPDGMSYGVSFLGLDGAVRQFTRKGMMEEEASLLLAVRIVSWLEFRLREESQRHGMRLVLLARSPFSEKERPRGGFRDRARTDGRLHPLLAGAVLPVTPADGDLQHILAHLHAETGASGAEWTVET